MTLEKVAERIYADTSGSNGGNFGAVVLDNEIVFIDSGMYHHVTQREMEHLKKLYEKPVMKMLLTHYHSDHIWGAQGLGPVSIVSSSETRELCAVIYSNPDDMEKRRAWAEEMKEERPDLWTAVQTLQIRLPDIVFEDEVTIGVDQSLKMWRVGGHTPGSSVVIVEPEHILFCGDLIFNGSFPYAGDEGSDPDQWISVLQEIKEADYSMIISGHGKICNKDTVQEHIEFLTELRDRIKTSVSEDLTPDEFIEKRRVPEFYIDEKSQHRIQSTVERWFEFYKESEEDSP